MIAAPGTLFVVATPIGNLGDLSPRAQQVLASVALVACEDTRRSGQLLTGPAHPRLVSLHEHNESARIEEIIAVLRSGADVALVSDAGTPLVSDPGFRLLAALRAADLPVSPVPGPCAAIAALSIAGLPSDRFHFEGFLPARAVARQQRLQALSGSPYSLVFYEAVHRIDACLADLVTAFGAERQATVCRELTKRHEAIYRGSLGNMADLRAADPGAGKGEFTLVVAGAAAAAGPGEAELERVFRLLAGELPPGRAAALAARITGAKRADAYRLASLPGPD